MLKIVYNKSMSMIARMKKKFYFVAAGYFRFFANMVMRRWRPRVIAITGSAGKTTMLNLMELQMGERAHYSHNANSAFGVAFDVMGFDGIRGSKLRWIWLFILAIFRGLTYKRTEKFYVVEIDGERPREAEFLAEWLRPEVVMWVSFGMSHAVQFEGVVKAGKFANVKEAILHEFGSLARAAQKLVLIDGDLEEMKLATEGILAKVEKVSVKNLKKYKVAPRETIFEASDGNEVNKFVFDHAEPRDVLVQILMMQRVMKYLKMGVKCDLSGVRMAPGRSSVFDGKNGSILIDSTYNAHMISMESILKMAREIKAKRKILVIGDIVEQGKIEGEEHTRLAEVIFEVGAEKVVLVGRRVKKWTAPKLKKMGVDVVVFDEVKGATGWLMKNATEGDLVVFKGSQYLEWAVEQMLFNEDDAKFLARREAAAVKRRKKWGLEGE